MQVVEEKIVINLAIRRRREPLLWRRLNILPSEVRQETVRNLIRIAIQREAVELADWTASLADEPPVADEEPDDHCTTRLTFKSGIPEDKVFLEYFTAIARGRRRRRARLLALRGLAQGGAAPAALSAPAVEVPRAGPAAPFGAMPQRGGVVKTGAPSHASRGSIHQQDAQELLSMVPMKG